MTDSNQLIYAIRQSDPDGLAFEPVTMDDVMTDDGVELLTFDALVVPQRLLERKMTQLNAIMALAANTVKPIAFQISEPFRQKGTTNIAVIFELSDGQTITIYFHNPDTTPNRILPDDELISWKWLLNKKDITILVAQESGKDLSPREVARRIIKLVEKNSARFIKANANRAERLAGIDVLKTEVDDKERELQRLDTELERLKQIKPIEQGIVAMPAPAPAVAVEPAPVAPMAEQPAAAPVVPTEPVAPTVVAPAVVAPAVEPVVEPVAPTMTPIAPVQAAEPAMPSKKDEATAYINSIINSEINLHDADIADKLVDLAGEYDNDPDMMKLIDDAITVYSDAALAAAQRELSNA